jgi:hypothetical protein
VVVGFSGSASDPEDGALGNSSLSWEIVLHDCASPGCQKHLLATFNGVGGGSFTAPNGPSTGIIEIRLTAIDSGGLAVTVSSSYVNRSAGAQPVNQAPAPSISKPGSTYTWGAGVIVGFGGSATDPEDGALAASKLSWQVIWHNGASHTLIHSASGVSGGTFTAPGALSGTVEVILTATDSAGASSSVSRTYDHR